LIIATLSTILFERPADAGAIAEKLLEEVDQQWSLPYNEISAREPLKLDDERLR
jgi:hypothetical protein